MKILLLNADQRGFKDGVTWGQLFKHLPIADSISQADCVVIAAVCQGSGFKFNHELNDIVGKKPIVVVNYQEFGWQYAHDRNNVLGGDYVPPCGGEDCDEWGTLNLFVSQCNPVLQFHRELRKEDVASNVIPIDFLAPLSKQPLDSRDKYNARPYDVFNSFGYSHPNRARVHGEIFIAMGTKGINVIDGYDKLGGNSQPIPARTWLSIFTPHWVRKSMAEVLEYQSQSKISLSLFGAGRKCFRHSESSENCIMGYQELDLAFSFPWDESNSIVLHENHEVDELIAALKRNDLHEIYLAAQNNLDRYRSHRYISEYILPEIEKRL